MHETTSNGWREQYGGMRVQETQRLQLPTIVGEYSRVQLAIDVEDSTLE